MKFLGSGSSTAKPEDRVESQKSGTVRFLYSANLSTPKQSKSADFDTAKLPEQLLGPFAFDVKT
jgi:hypothetical protein